MKMQISSTQSPTSALDPISTLKIEDLMDDLRKKYTVVIVDVKRSDFNPKLV